MPYFRRMPKRGFPNVNFKTQFWIVNLGAIASHPDFQNGGEVNPDRLIRAGLVRDDSRPVKILGDMRTAVGRDDSLSVKLQITADRVSDRAKRVVESAGGSVNELGTRRDRVRGVDRNSPDRTPKNLTKRRPKARTPAGADTSEAKQGKDKSKGKGKKG